jgi:DNA replication protein DnaC
MFRVKLPCVFRDGETFVSCNYGVHDSGRGKLVGRREDLERIDQLLDSTADVPGVLLLSGEPGVGKTALLDAIAQRASAAGARVLRAAGAEFETEMTY